MSSHRRRLRWLASGSAALITAGAVMALAPLSPANTSVANAASWEWLPWSHHPVLVQAVQHHRTAQRSGAAAAATAPTAAGPAVAGTPTAAPDPSPLTHADRAARPASVSPSPSRPAPSAQVPSAQAPAAPVTAAPAGTAASSGSGVPTGDLPGWRLVLSQDFTRDAGLGQFASVYPGWAAYDGAHDTSGHGTYDSSTTTTVRGGVLDEYLHTQDGTPQVMALTPPNGGSHQTYGRYAVRFRSDLIPGYKIAWLLWPSDDNWSEGELDFPEADLDHTIEGYAHDVTGSPSRNAWSVETGTSLTDWHTAVVEWSPSGLTYTLDDRSWHTSDSNAVPHNPMDWVLQTETAENGPAPGASVSGHIQIDWVAAWAATG